MAIQFLYTIKGRTEHPCRLFIGAADQEELSIFNDMRKTVIRSIPSVTKIDRGGILWVGSIHHFRKGTIFIALASRLNEKVCKSPVKDRIKGIDVDLVKPSC
ncbi:hypothetical protein K040078D81_45210 [Blautia hominis]|uniref:DUF4258 domain-containing protein n=1 Tax=Blautia hominis TaxID=2025493 RepID=A0ABQ0BG55_9FIRM